MGLKIHVIVKDEGPLICHRHTSGGAAVGGTIIPIKRGPDETPGPIW